MQADVVLSQSIVDFSSLFTEIADTYIENGLFMEARPIYEMLGADAAVCSLSIDAYVAIAADCFFDPPSIGL